MIKLFPYNVQKFVRQKGTYTINVLDEATVSLLYNFTTDAIHWKLLFSFYQLQMCEEILSQVQNCATKRPSNGNQVSFCC
jgi:hypothetical protein